MQKTAVIDRRYSRDRIYEMASTLFWNSDILIGEEERWNWRKGWDSNGNLCFNYSVTTTPLPELCSLITNERQ